MMRTGAGGERAADACPDLSHRVRTLRASLSFLWVLAQPPAEEGQQGKGLGLRGDLWESAPWEGWKEELPW